MTDSRKEIEALIADSLISHPPPDDDNETIDESLDALVAAGVIIRGRDGRYRAAIHHRPEHGESDDEAGYKPPGNGV